VDGDKGRLNMRVMFTFFTTEDYIVKAKNIKEAQKIIKIIRAHKQDSQKDLIRQYNIDYSIDVTEHITKEENEK
tara:strand:- start:200 stop:421 length:222 start_codon:yes stop_codon:yes gene_type:complete